MSYKMVEQRCKGDKGKYGVWLKKAKNRHERRQARKDPEAPANYKQYFGYST